MKINNEKNLFIIERRFERLRRLALAGAATLLLGSTAQAQQAGAGSVEAFYKGKQLNFVVGLAAGGGYDQYARAIARHLDRYLPGKPTIVVQNMTGAGGLNATNWLYTIAPRDGLTIGMTQRSVIVEPLYGTKAAIFDPNRFSWIASVNDEAYIAVTWKDRGINSISDALTREFPVSADGPASDDYTWPAVLNNVIGTRFNIISGYKGKAEQRLSARRGETVGLIGWSWGALQGTEWADYKAGNWKIIAHLGHGKHPDFDAPSIFDYAKTKEAKDVLDFLVGTLVVGRPVFAPPDVPSDRIEALRSAFIETMKDPIFLAEAEKQKLEISPTPGAELAERIKRLYATPPEVVARTQAARKAK
jgi:tripartite-type tricarboxylate transporter receptor subunit TctC